MLQSIRDNAQGIFVWIIVGAIIVAFALFGLGSYLSGASRVVAASVNGVEITESALTREYQNHMERLRQMFGDQFRPEMLGEANLKKDVLQGMITDEVLNQMMQDQHYQASAVQVYNQIRQIEAFHEDGEFSEQRYKEVLQVQRINNQAFEADLARSIASQQIRGAIADTAFLTKSEKEYLASLENQQREIVYFNISANLYKKSISVSEEEITAFYEKNKNKFMTPEQVAVEYVELKMDDVAAVQEVTEEMIEQQYESSPENYYASDEVAAKQKADKLLKQIKAGADFAEVAKQNSSDKASAAQGGDLGYVTRGISEEFDNAVFALNKGQVSDVVKSKQGYQILKLEDIRKGDPEERKVSLILVKPERKLKPLAEVRDAIKKELQYQQASKVFYEDADKLNNLSFESPDSLAPAADALGLEVKSSPYMTRRGGTGLMANPKIITAAFSDEVTREGKNSELLEISDTHTVVLRVKQYKPAAVEPLDKVRKQVEFNLVNDKAAAKANNVADDILTRLNNNETVADIRNAYPEVKWNNNQVISRKADNNDGVPTQVRQFSYTLAKPAEGERTWGKVVLRSGNQAVVGLSDVKLAKESQDFDATSVTRIMGKSDYSSFVDYLKSQADISITPVSAN